MHPRKERNVQTRASGCVYIQYCELGRASENGLCSPLLLLEVGNLKAVFCVSSWRLHDGGSLNTATAKSLARFLSLVLAGRGTWSCLCKTNDSLLKPEWYNTFEGILTAKGRYFLCHIRLRITTTHSVTKRINSALQIECITIDAAFRLSAFRKQALLCQSLSTNLVQRLKHSGIRRLFPRSRRTF